jgi:hypothetical protein
MLNKRVRWSSRSTFSQEYKVDKYKSQNDNIQLQKKKDYQSGNGMHFNPNNKVLF